MTRLKDLVTVPGLVEAASLVMNMNVQFLVNQPS